MFLAYKQNADHYRRQQRVSHPGSFRLHGCWSHHFCFVVIHLFWPSELLTINTFAYFRPARTRYNHPACVPWILKITIILI